MRKMARAGETVTRIAEQLNRATKSGGQIEHPGCKVAIGQDLDLASSMLHGPVISERQCDLEHAFKLKLALVVIGLERLDLNQIVDVEEQQSWSKHSICVNRLNEQNGWRDRYSIFRRLTVCKPMPMNAGKN